MNFHSVNSFPELNIEYELPFYMRAMGENYDVPPLEKPEGYNRHYIGIVQKGKLWLQLGRCSFHLEQGDGFFVRSHFPFCYHSEEEKCAVQWLVFDGYATIPLFSKLELENYMIFHNLNLSQFTIDFRELYLNSINTDKASRLKNSVLVYKLLIKLYTSTEKGQEELGLGCENPYFLRGKRCIEQYYASLLTQKEIADAAGVTPQYLCRLFQTYMHMTPITYLNMVRIKQAKFLLQTTSLSVRVIGENVGIHTPHYFSKIFQKQEGMTPTKYRELVTHSSDKE